MRTDPVLKANGVGYAFALHGTVLIHLWRTTATLEAVQTLRRIAVESGARIEGMLVVIDDFGALPTETVREELLRVARHAASTYCVVVYAGSGFKAAALRGLVTSVFTLTGRRNSMSVVSSLPAARDWARKHGHPLPELLEMEAHVTCLREELSKRAA
jgi:hypothetical protein